MGREFSVKEEKILKKHFSNVDKKVFCLDTPEQADRGALMSRYSRTTHSMRRVFLNEFINTKKRGEVFYKKVLGQYGDDSIAELGFAHIAIEGISNIAVKTIEDRRVGLSYLEKSSRYVPWNKKINSKFAFYRDPRILKSRYADDYLDACNDSFETYSRLIDPITHYIREVYPIERQYFANNSKKQVLFGKLDSEGADAAQRAYLRTIKAKMYDTLRVLLPASTLTNVGVAGNGRAFEYLLTILFSSRLEEEREIAVEIKRELNKSIGAFIQRSDDSFGRDLQKYHKNIKIISKKSNPKSDKQMGQMIKLVKYVNESIAMNDLITGIMYQGANGTSYDSILKHVKKLSLVTKKKIINQHIALRKNRRYRPPRAFELVEYTFDIQSDYGVFRDLHRHRALTLQRQNLTCDHDYFTPQEVIGAGLKSEFVECMNNTRHVYNKMKKSMPIQAQYVVNFAYNYHYMIKMNLREACHMIELRSTPQGHPEYRRVAQQMFRQIISKHPILGKIIKFVNLEDVDLERLESEKRFEQKRKNSTKK